MSATLPQRSLLLCYSCEKFVHLKLNRKEGYLLRMMSLRIIRENHVVTVLSSHNVHCTILHIATQPPPKNFLFFCPLTLPELHITPDPHLVGVLQQTGSHYGSPPSEWM